MSISYEKNNVSHNYDVDFFYNMSDEDVKDFIRKTKGCEITIKGHFMEVANIRNRVGRVGYEMIKINENIINIFESSSVIKFEEFEEMEDEEF